MLVERVEVYGFEDSIKASKYPMAVNVIKCTDEITQTVLNLALSKMGADTIIS